MVENSIKKWVRKEILSLNAYQVSDSKGLIKMDAMENPYSLPDTIKQDWVSLLEKMDLNRYPDPECKELKGEIRKQFKILESCGLLLGNGSDELIQMIAILLGGKDRTFVAPSPSFSMYQQISIATSTQFIGVPLNADFSIDGKNLIRAIKKYDPSCVFLAYPNNPTGNCFDDEIIAEVLDVATGLVILDEAYYAFCRETYLYEIENYQNLIVLRTLSKSGLAGLRLGLMIGNQQWISEFEKIRLPYNINCLTQASTVFYLKHNDILDQQARQIIENRSWLINELEKVVGIVPYNSEANFILFKSEINANQVYETLKKKGVLIKNLHGSDSLLENCLRVTVGSEQDNDNFINAIKSM